VQIQNQKKQLFLGKIWLLKFLTKTEKSQSEISTDLIKKNRRLTGCVVSLENKKVFPNFFLIEGKIAR